MDAFIETFSTRTENMTPAELQTILDGAAENMVICTYFSATWCGPCRKVQPLVQSLVDTHPNLRVYKVDADTSKQLLDQHGVSTLPTFVFFKRAQVISRHSGAQAQMVQDAFQNAMRQ